MKIRQVKRTLKMKKKWNYLHYYLLLSGNELIFFYLADDNAFLIHICGLKFVIEREFLIRN